MVSMISPLILPRKSSHIGIWILHISLPPITTPLSNRQQVSPLKPTLAFNSRYQPSKVTLKLPTTTTTNMIIRTPLGGVW